LNVCTAFMDVGSPRVPGLYTRSMSLL